MQERLVDVISSLVADPEPAVLANPRQRRSLHHPPVPPQSLAALNPLPGYTALDAALPERLFALFVVVVGFVRVKLLGALSRCATRKFDGRLYGINEFLKHHRIVDVWRSDHHRQRDAASVDHKKVALRARFSLIRRIRTALLAPLLAGMLAAESTQAR